MLKITGLDKLTRELTEAQLALSELESDLGNVKLDPHDPASIEAAIQSINQMVDQRVGQYESNPIVAPIIEQMKDAYRASIIEKAAAARLEPKKDE